MNTDEKPISIGGGTDAKALESGVGFGPELIGEISTVHQPDEFIELKNIYLLEKIYYKAIKELLK